jgi:hypothetical protein
MSQLLECLGDLENRIDLDEDHHNRCAWIDYLEGRNDQDPFVPPSRTQMPPAIVWPEININDALQDIDLMILREFSDVSRRLSEGDNTRFNVRANYGTSILPSLFGCELHIMDRANNTLPAALPLHDEQKIKRLIKDGVPDLDKGQGRTVFACGQRLMEVLADFPKLTRAIHIYHPDLQGPIDVAEVVWGSEIFLAVYDNPEMLQDMLELITETYIAFMKRWLEIVPWDGPYSSHWGWMLKGYPMIRNDSLMNLSPEIYERFVRPCDQRIFNAFGGEGGQHFCGRGDHYIDLMSEMEGLSVLVLSQPEYNDMEKIYRHTVDKGICLIQPPNECVDSAVKVGRNLNGRVMAEGI